jgi:hypothetical protein
MSIFQSISGTQSQPEYSGASYDTNNVSAMTHHLPRQANAAEASGMLLKPCIVSFVVNALRSVGNKPFADHPEIGEYRSFSNK